jgi:hypothetical protein
VTCGANANAHATPLSAGVIATSAVILWPVRHLGEYSSVQGKQDVELKTTTRGEMRKSERYRQQVLAANQVCHDTDIAYHDVSTAPGSAW